MSGDSPPLGSRPEPDDQGPVETCVRHAVGKGVVAAAHEKGFEFRQNEAVVLLLNDPKRKDIFRVYPTAYNNAELLLEDKNRKDGVSHRYASLRIVKCRPEDFVPPSDSVQYVIAWPKGKCNFIVIIWTVKLK